MRLTELAAANDLLGDPEALSARYDQDGCLLVRNAFALDRIRELIDHVAAVLERWGVGTATGDPPVLRWTGRPLEFLDSRELYTGIAAFTRSTDEFVEFQAAQQAFLDQVCGHRMHHGAGGYFYLGIPDDPGYTTHPHRDGYARSATGDYRRTWVAATDIPFGDGGLAVALGSHKIEQLPWSELSEYGFKRRPDAYHPGPKPLRRGGIDPDFCDDNWHTAQMHPGDALIFSPRLVHRGVPATSDRIRLAVAFTSSDEMASAGWTTLEDIEGIELIREIGDPLGFSNADVMRIRSALYFAGLPYTEATVREAIAVEHEKQHPPVPTASG